jgi:hypothetical protein
MLRRWRSVLATTAAAIVAVSMIGPSTALAGDVYATNVGPLYGWSSWVIGHYGYLSANQAAVYYRSLCATAIEASGGGEAGSAVCSPAWSGAPVVITRNYCGCADRTAAVRHADYYNGGGVTSYGFIQWAQDW